MAYAWVMSSHSRFLPNFCDVYSIFALVLLAELLAMLLTAAATESADQFWSQLGLTSLFSLWITLISAFLLCATQRWWRMWSVGAACGLVVAVVEGMGLGAVLAVTKLVPDVGLTNSVFIFAKTGLIAGVCTGLWLRYQYVLYQRRLQSQAEAAARLDALQARMRPHFLFNSLNAIASLLRQDARRAEDLLLDLAELFRAILKQDQRLTSFDEEVRLARQYLNIEQQRLGDRLNVEWSIDPGAGRCQLPPLSLQPLVENAVYHGIEPSALPGSVSISARLSRNRLVVTVTNTLPGSSEASSSGRSGNKVAVDNLRHRLDRCFSGEARLQTSVVDDRYQTRLIVPVTEASA